MPDEPKKARIRISVQVEPAFQLVVEDDQSTAALPLTLEVARQLAGDLLAAAQHLDPEGHDLAVRQAMARALDEALLEAIPPEGGQH